LLEVLVLGKKGPIENIDDDIGLANINQHVIFENDWLFLANEDSIAHTKILDVV